MRFSFGQELRLEQRQILTQRMIQSMEILQLSALQLDERIDVELEKNPVLELSTDIPDSGNSDEVLPNESADYDREMPDSTVGMDSSIIQPADKTDGSDDGQEQHYEHEPEMTFDSESSGIREEFQTADDFAQNYTDTIDELPARSQNWLEEQENRRNDVFANAASPPQTLQEYLTEQLNWFDLSPEMQKMTERVIYNIDANGYFPYELDDFLGEERTDEEKTLAEKALELVRKLDPPGVGAKNLKDCLLLQVAVGNPLGEVIALLIQNHLEDISCNRLPQIVRATGESFETIQEAIGELKHLNPRPAAGFDTETEAFKIAVTVTPDVTVERDEEGRYIVRLEEGKSRGLSINPYYEKMKKRKGADKETSEFVAKNVGAARWLIEAIEQRRMTLLKVSQAIVNYQTAFFENGPQALKPLKMQQIADTVGIHITTVSRACNDKWMLTPQGVFPFSKFFSSAVASSNGGESVAQDAVRLKLKEIIAKEDKSAPYNDDAIVKLLADSGIKVARRTVVKYRDQMNIPNSAKRKEW
ncbi:MAG: RNA polymerase factor sigma-54 [Planctomycetaceae bacterium]|jgi:RNA polymerase sigma-54 factor|nr:RNA polymerase factor sigma-54 [Planctomycetaceae bacterium]